ncbi:M81 family metallopeptidase [Luteipulveratus halotolerans]|uniref:M81 family metallopeptidase n=1 Tax=Luteipulveratus halotolerans TaxID=1631356 RepID=UPI000ACE67AB|nr:M81 family metallopeptidase [Luteipulveratus halotolerans]
MARALPGGRVERSAYDALLADVLAAIDEGGPWDGVLLDIHGAMLVERLDDAEAHLAAAVREAVGPAALIAAAMDLHGSVSRAFVESVDLPTCYRTAPHVDEEETRARAARLLARCLTDGTRPVRAWARVPVVLPGEKTSTRDEPARSIYASLADGRRPVGVLETALWVGYAWADEPRTAAAVVSVGTDEAAVQAEVDRVARAWFDARGEFEFCCETGDLAWAVDRALTSDRRPFFVSDTGDNPTAGGSGDVATTLASLLADRSVTEGRHQVVWSALVDPDGVAAAHAAGVGASFDEVVGGCYGWPARIRLQGKVLRCTEGEIDSAVIAVGSLCVVLTSGRIPFHAMSDYAAVGVDPSTVDVFVDKIGYLEPDLHEHAEGWVMALTDGPVDQRIERLPFDRVRDPLYPLTPVPHDWSPEAVVIRS